MLNMIFHFSTAKLSVRWRGGWKTWSTWQTNTPWSTYSIPSISWMRPARTWTASTPAAMTRPGGLWCPWEPRRAARTSPPSRPAQTWRASPWRGSRRLWGHCQTTSGYWGELTCSDPALSCQLIWLKLSFQLLYTILVISVPAAQRKYILIFWLRTALYIFLPVGLANKEHNWAVSLCRMLWWTSEACILVNTVRSSCLLTYLHQSFALYDN